MTRELALTATDVEHREWIKEVPDELTTIVTHRRMLPVAAMPEELHGRHVVMVGTCYAGPVEEGERVLEPLRQFGSPLLDRCAPMPFTNHQAALDPSSPIPGGTTSVPATWRS